MAISKREQESPTRVRVHVTLSGIGGVRAIDTCQGVRHGVEGLVKAVDGFLPGRERVSPHIR